VYWDSEGKNRTPKDRNFRPGEFEELYKSLPTFEYYFEQGFTPLDPLIMDRVVQAIKERRPEIELKLATFDARGQAHATFTVLHKDAVEAAKADVTAGYERRILALEAQKEQLMDVIHMLGSGNVALQPMPGGVAVTHTLPPELTQQIVAMFCSFPSLETESGQRTLIKSAGLDPAVATQIQFGSPAAQFCQLLVDVVGRYGRMQDGRIAIEAVLAAAKQLVGIDGQAECDQLIQQMQAEYAGWQTARTI
jgi:hypothetical protein